MTENLLAEFEPDPSPLLGLIRQNVDDSMLREIADADYGEDFELHYEVLLEIYDGKIPFPFKFHPSEVLELTLWSLPEDPLLNPSGNVTRRHWTRLFCCVALLRAGIESSNRIHCNDASTIQLVDSVLKLGEETTRAGLSFLSWRLNQYSEIERERQHCAVGCLLLIAALGQCDETTVNEILDSVWKTADYHGEYGVTGGIQNGTYGDVWERHIRNILLNGRVLKDVDSQSMLTLFAKDLLGER